MIIQGLCPVCKQEPEASAFALARPALTLYNQGITGHGGRPSGRPCEQSESQEATAWTS